MSYQYLFITALVGLVIFLAGEYLWRKKLLQEEFARKFVHIGVGVFAAFWPLYLTWDDIRVISILLAIAYLCIRRLALFSSIARVDRKTYGEVLFALSFGLISLITSSVPVYMLAVLVMALADGLAALVGTTYGKNNSYVILGGTKSVAGSIMFFTVTLTLIAIFGLYTPIVVPIGISVSTAIIATVMENVGLYGLDNVLIPSFIAMVFATVS